MRNRIIAIIAIVTLMSSCSIEKRHYMSGYHVDWHSRSAKVEHHKHQDTEDQTTVASNGLVNETAINTEQPCIQEVINVESVELTEQTASSNQNISKEEIKAEKKLNRIISQTLHQKDVTSTIDNTAQVNQVEQKSENADTELLLLALLAILLPPLAVFLFENSITTNFWISVILTLLGWLPGIIFAFYIIFF